MSTTRKTAALRNLAERPGTEAEGKLAREILERLEQEQIVSTEEEEEYFKSRYNVNAPIVCDCGAWVQRGTLCASPKHERIKKEKLDRFPKGTRVYYNRWAYSPNCPGVVTGPSKYWNWIRVKFDHLKQARTVPIYSAKSWYLFTEPITDPAVLRSLRGGMEDIEAQP